MGEKRETMEVKRIKLNDDDPSMDLIQLVYLDQMGIVSWQHVLSADEAEDLHVLLGQHVLEIKGGVRHS